MIKKDESQIDISYEDVVEKNNVQIQVVEGLLREEVEKWYEELKR